MATNTLGYGGINYNTANKSGKQSIAQNQNKIANDQQYKQDEINRTLSVIANREKQGLDTSAQQKYLTSNLGYAAPSNQSNVMVQAANNVKSTPQATYTPPTSPTADTLNRINDFIAKQSQFQYTAPESFTYDQNSDPAYQAQLAEAKRNVESQQADTNAFLRAGGQGKSSYSEMVANQVGTNAMQSIANDLVPTLMNQAYQRYNDNANRNLQVQQLNYGIGQDALSNLTNLYGLQDNEYFQKPIAEAQLTGNYLPNEARQVINQILGLKQQAESQGITAQERTGLSQRADVLRSQLQALGIDPSLYGADVNYNNASKTNAGIRTLAGQQLDLSKQAQNFDQQFAQEQFAYQKIRDEIADEKWKKQFDEDVRQFGLQHALTRQVQLGGLSIDRARLALSQAAQDNDRLMDIWKATGSAPEGIKGVTAGTVYGGENASTVTAESYATSYLDKAAQYDDDGLLLNSDAIENSILESGLPSSELRKLYMRYGIPIPK